MSNDYTVNSTTLEPTDAPLDKQQQYRRYRRNNRAGQQGKWRDNNAYIPQDRDNVFDAIGGQLALTEYQIARGKHILASLPDDHFRGNPISVVCLVVAGYVGRQDGREYHPRNLLRNDPNLFAEQATSIGVGYSELSSCWYRVVEDI